MQHITEDDPESASAASGITAPDIAPPDITRVHRATYRSAIRLAQSAREAAAEVGLGRDIVELVNIRVSQINGCGACLSAHVPPAHREGVSHAKLHLLSVWRDVSVYTPLERAALEVAELTTQLPQGSADQAAAAAARAGVSAEQLAALEWVAIAIGAFNRISIMSKHDAHYPYFEKMEATS